MGIAQMLLGAAGVKIQLPVTGGTSVISGGGATASVELAASGDINGTNGNNVVADRGDWIIPKFNMADYECRLDITSGALSTGTAGAWLSLGSNRSWTVSRGSLGISTCNYTLQIRHIASGLVMASGPGTLQAEWN